MVGSGIMAVPDVDYLGFLRCHRGIPPLENGEGSIEEEPPRCLAFAVRVRG